MSASPLTPLSESVTMSSPSIQGDGYRHHIGNAAPPAVDSVHSDQFPHPVEGVSCAHEIMYVHNCTFGISATSWSPHVLMKGLVGGSSSGTVHTNVSKKHERGGRAERYTALRMPSI